MMIKQALGQLIGTATRIKYVSSEIFKVHFTKYTFLMNFNNKNSFQYWTYVNVYDESVFHFHIINKIKSFNIFLIKFSVLLF